MTTLIVDESTSPSTSRTGEHDDRPADAFNIKQFVKTLPHLPGCYRYFDAQGQCLYVGKARDLKNRVSTYFRKTGLSARIAWMVSQIATIETTVTRSEAEALLLENNLIKTLHPRYNIQMRDSATYPYLRFGPEPFTRLSYYRGGVDKKSTFFGPYPNAGAAKKSIEFLQKVFRIRTCEDGVFKNRTRPCLLGQINRCSAPCCGQIDLESYRQDCQRAMDFLNGKTRHVIDELERKMWHASDTWAFEEAARYRDTIAALTTMQHQQATDTRGLDLDADVIFVAIEQGHAVVNLALIRGGRHLGDRAIFPKLKVGDERMMPEAHEILSAFISTHYAELPVPAVVITDKSILTKAQAHALSELLSAMRTKKVSVIIEPRETRRAWLQMCIEGAYIALRRHLQEEGTQKARLRELLEVLEVEPPEGDPMRFSVECFDISHTAGEATQASCVVFKEGQMQSSLYRRFNITGIEPGDDYGAMKQVLTRRYLPVTRGEAQLPSLVLIDGGKGQVEMARQVFDELGLDPEVLVGVAKGEGRKVGLETLIFPCIQGVRRPALELGSLSQALMLIAQIRDEAHRFAITGMRAKRAKTRQNSKLEDFEGIGPKRRAKLLAHFGGMKQLRNASREDIAKVSGISKAMADKLYCQLHENPVEKLSS